MARSEAILGAGVATDWKVEVDQLDQGLPSEGVRFKSTPAPRLEFTIRQL